MVGTRVRGSRMGKKKPKGAGDWAERKPFALQMRGSPDWKKWVEGLSKFDRSTVADVADRALAAYARTIGYPEPPPPR